MRPSTYFSGENQELFLQDIRAIMNLFQIGAAGPPLGRSSWQQLAEDSFYIDNYAAIEADAVRVSTAVFVRESGAVVSFEQAHQAASLPVEAAKTARRLVRLNLLLLMRRITGEKGGPWGILSGVRPGKMVRKLLEPGLTPETVIDKLIGDYALDRDKAELIVEVVGRQNRLPQFRHNARQISVYIGIPYCPSRCLYCSFPGFALPAEAAVGSFLTALAMDLRAARQLIDQYGLELQTVYIGGGTPTSLLNEQFRQLLEMVKFFLGETVPAEYTVEAGRPDSLNQVKLELLKQYNVNRVSLNPQTMQEKTLKLIGRKHTVEDIISMFQKLRSMEQFYINMDIIAGLPGETEADMQDTVTRIAALHPDNVTVHTLALKKGSRLKMSLEECSELLPGRQTTENMLAIARQAMAELNMHPYYLYRQKYMSGNLENVGYAKAGTECIYNVQIMEENQTILGVGPAATTKAVQPLTGQIKNCYHPKDVHTYMKNLTTYLAERNAVIAGLFE